MRYLVLIRHGFGVYTVARALSRSRLGHVSCVESIADPDRGAGGMTWRTDGRYRLTTATGSRLRSRRRPLAGLADGQLAYLVPGPVLLDPRLPLYTPDMEGATVQIAADAVMAEPHRIELQILLTPSGHVPAHRETVGDRLIEAGDPSIWMVLRHDSGDGDGAGAVAAYAPRPRPRVWAAARPPIER